MAISSELIGSLGGGGEVTQGRFWFASSNRSFSELEKSWNVPRGNYLFAWQGSLSNYFFSGTNQLLVNGQAFYETVPNGQASVGGFVVLYNVATIALTGVGGKRFVEDPYAAFVRVK